MTADVIARLSLVQSLAEHLDARADGLSRLPETHDLHLFAGLHNSALHAARDHRAAALDAEHVLDWHQEGLVLRSLWLRNVAVDGVHELPDRLVLRRVRVIRLTFHRLQGAPADDWNVIAGEVVLRQQLSHLELNEIEQLRVLHHIYLVQEHDHRRHFHLPRQQDVLPRLRHRSVVRRDDEYRPVHLGGTCDHVLDVVSVARTVDVRVVPLLRLVFHVRDRDRNAALALFRRLVDAEEVTIFSHLLQRQHLRDGRRQRRLTMVDMADRAHVEVWLRAHEFLFGHCGNPSCYRSRVSGRASRPDVSMITRLVPTVYILCRRQAQGAKKARDVRSLISHFSSLRGAHDRTRTGDPVLTKNVLYQLSYVGVIQIPFHLALSFAWWRGEDSNLRSPKAASLQPAAIVHSATPPSSQERRTRNMELGWTHSRSWFAVPCSMRLEPKGGVEPPT